MSEDILDKFGMLLMHQVRDRVIEELDRIISGKAPDRTYMFLRDRTNLSDANVKEALQIVIPIAVDHTLDSFLDFIESQNEIDLVYEQPNGTETISIKDASDGLAGELYSSRGWVAKFSNKRNYENEIFKDL